MKHQEHKQTFMKYCHPFQDANRRLFACLAAMTIVLVSGLAGQSWSLAVNTEFGPVDNLFGSKLVGDQFLTEGHVEFAYYFSDDMRFTGSLYRSEVITENVYSTSWWQGGAQWRNLDSDHHHWYAGLSYSGRRFTETYSYYDHDDIMAYLEWKFSPHPQWFIRLGYDLQAESFREEPQESNTVHRLYVKGMRSFNTGTAMQAGIDLSYQDFWTPPAAPTNGYTFTSMSSTEEFSANQLVVGTFRLSQSLHSRVGLALQTDWQYRLNQDQIGAAVPDHLTNLFIDHFDWEGNSLNAILTILLPWQLTAVPSVRRSVRDYVDIPVYLYDFNTNTFVLEEESYVISHRNRADTQTSFQIQLRRSWHLPLVFSFDTIGTSLTLGWIENKSNDPLFNYAGGMVTLGLHFNLDK